MIALRQLKNRVLDRKHSVNKQNKRTDADNRRRDMKYFI
jgi:hypothetical protein